ncbi:hypothetical protein GGI02_002632 [Coemansia sp. RSA 2322]|nr:hypothetical protein GGI02_002632 [Coemansia sp. RSA 2322]
MLGTLKQPAMRIDIVHPHTYESVVSSDHATFENVRLRTPPPMNYWLNSDDEDEDSGDVETSCFDSLRTAPQPIPQAQKGRFSREEWQGRADGALFGSHRRRCDMRPDSTTMPSDNYPLAQSLPTVSFSSSLLSSNIEPRPDSVLDGLSCAPQQQNQKMPLLYSKNDWSLESTSAYQKCVAALNELLFATNAQVDEEMQALVRHYVNGQTASQFMPVFDGIVDQAFEDFSMAAQSILAVADQASARYSLGSADSRRTHEHYDVCGSLSGNLTGSMESLLTEIVSSYMGLAATSTPTRQHKDTARSPNTKCALADGPDPISPGSLERMLRSFNINVVKYSKEQLRLFATTGLAKYVTSQVLLSTGIENDLIDKLDEAAEELSHTMDQVDMLDSVSSEPTQASSNGDVEDIATLRLRAAQYRDNVDRIQLEARDAGYTRRIFESIMAEIQAQ